MGNKANSSSDINNNNSEELIMKLSDNNNDQEHDEHNNRRVNNNELLQQPASAEKSKENTSVPDHVRTDQVMGSSSPNTDTVVREIPDSRISRTDDCSNVTSTATFKATEKQAECPSSIVDESTSDINIREKSNCRFSRTNESTSVSATFDNVGEEPDCRSSMVDESVREKPESRISPTDISCTVPTSGFTSNTDGKILDVSQSQKQTSTNNTSPQSDLGNGREKPESRISRIEGSKDIQFSRTDGINDIPSSSVDSTVEPITTSQSKTASIAKKQKSPASVTTTASRHQPPRGAKTPVSMETHKENTSTITQPTGTKKKSNAIVVSTQQTTFATFTNAPVQKHTENTSTTAQPTGTKNKINATVASMQRGTSAAVTNAPALLAKAVSIDTKKNTVTVAVEPSHNSSSSEESSEDSVTSSNSTAKLEPVLPTGPAVDFNTPEMRALFGDDSSSIAGDITIAMTSPRVVDSTEQKNVRKTTRQKKKVDYTEAPIEIESEGNKIMEIIDVDEDDRILYNPDRYEQEDAVYQEEKIEIQDMDTSIAAFKDLIYEEYLSVNLILLSLLIHSTPTTLFAQPHVNFRPLCINDLKDQKFIDAMVKEKQDIHEEMHVIFYELTSAGSKKAVSIFPTYPDDASKIEYKAIPKQYAKYPTKVGLQQMASFFNIKPADLDHSSIITLIKSIFSLLEESYGTNIIQRIFQNTFTKKDAVQAIPRDSLSIQQQYCAIKKEFQDHHNIRVAFLGGLHRTGLITHIMGNYQISTTKPTKADQSLYSVSETSTVNSNIVLHVFEAKNHSYSYDFMEQCRIFSEIIQRRKVHSIKSTIRSELYDLLEVKTDKEIEKLRYVPNDILLTKRVSYL